jgi:hypothetical protein
VEKHFRLRFIHFASLCCVIFVSCLSTSGQTVSLQLRTKPGRTEFHVGEVIPIDLLFTATTPNSYERNRGVQLPEPYPMPDTFFIEPREGWADPLGDYRKALFEAMHSGHFPMGGSIFSAKHVLRQEPYVLSLILNDYVRFFRPGRYALQIQDSGVISVTTQPGAMSEHLALTSNRLEIVILPADSEWQRNQLRESLDSLAQLEEAIDSHARSYKSGLADSCVSLRAMGIPASGTAMVNALRNEGLFSTCSFQVGILEFPDQRFILDRLRERLKDPDFPVTPTFFNTMAMISLEAEGHSNQLFGLGRDKIDRRLAQDLLSVVSLKRGQAKVQAISTLVTICFAAYGGYMGEFAHVRGEPSRLNARVLRVATANSEQLSAGVQTILRNYRNAHSSVTPRP